VFCHASDRHSALVSFLVWLPISQRSPQVVKGVIGRLDCYFNIDLQSMSLIFFF
jgi:hypothetical protein